MLTIDNSKTLLVVRSETAKPIVEAHSAAALGYECVSPAIRMNATVVLRGEEYEPVAGWTLGFVQLIYNTVDRAHYRGETVADGSIRVDAGYAGLCRDTNAGSTEIWYDSLLNGGESGPWGTNQLTLGRIPASGFLSVQAALFDQPHHPVVAIRPNLRTGGKLNFLHYYVAEFMFCTILVAQEPSGRRHMLRHVYWNTIWELEFARRGDQVVPGKEIRMQHNVQRRMGVGGPPDPRFAGREFDLTLPIANAVGEKPPRITEATDWSQARRG